MAKEHHDLLEDGEWIWADSAYPVRLLAVTNDQVV